MGQIASPRDMLQQTLQHVLQPDEQLLWSDYPHLMKLRFPLLSKEGLFDLLGDGIVAILLTTLWYGLDSLFGHRWSNLQTCMEMFLWVFGPLCLQTFLHTFTNVLLRRAPRYRRYTLYAITDRRVMIIVRLPGTEPTVLEYLPHEIDLPTSRVRPDGSGILAFGAPRHAKIGRYGPDFTLPGSFLGISRVQEVAALLQPLKSKSGPHTQDLTEQFSG